MSSEAFVRKAARPAGNVDRVVPQSRLSTIECVAPSLLIAAAVIVLLFVCTRSITHTVPALGVVGVIAAFSLFGRKHDLPFGTEATYIATVVIVLPLAPSLGPYGTYVRFAFATLGFALVVISLARRSPDRKQPAMTQWVFVLVCCLVVWCLGLAVVAASPLYGAIRFVNFAMFVPLVLLTFRYARAGAAVFAIIAMGVVQLLAVLLQSLGRYGGTWGGITVAGPSASILAERITRYTGYLLNPNNLGLVLAIATVVAVAVALFGDQIVVQVSALLVALLFLYGVILSSSRTALVAAIVSVLVLVYLRSLWCGLISSVLIVLIGKGASSVGLVELSHVLNSYSSIANDTDASSNQRTAVWADQLDKLTGWEIVVGKGFGGVDPILFSKDAVQGFRVRDNLLTAATVDNSWLKIWIEGGVFGVLLMASIVIGATVMVLARTISIRRSWDNRTGNAGSRRRLGAAAGSLGVLIVILFATFSYDVFDINPWNALIWVAVGYSLAQVCEGKAMWGDDFGTVSGGGGRMHLKSEPSIGSKAI